MSVRLLPYFVPPAVLLLVASVAAAQCCAPGTAKPKLVQKVYSVADLVVPVDDHGEPSVVALKNAPPAGDDKGTVKPAPKRTLETQLIRLIADTVQPDSWSQNGGLASMEYYPLGMALVISQTPAAQEQIEELLSALRRLQDVQVVIEARLIQLSEPFFERVGIDFETNPKTTPKQRSNDFSTTGLSPGLTPAGTHTPDLDIPIRCCDESNSCTTERNFEVKDIQNGVCLSDYQMFQFLEAASGDRRTNVLMTPKLTTLNGQEATIAITGQHASAAEPTRLSCGQQVASCGKDKTASPEVRLTVRPVVSADRRVIHVQVSADLAGPGATLSTRKACKIPDGSTIVITDWQVRPHHRKECAPPIVSRIPYINRLFKNAVPCPEPGKVVLLITPRVIVCKEEEVRATEVTCPHLKQQATPAPRPAVDAAAIGNSVIENIEKLEKAQKLYQKAEFYRRTGKVETAESIYHAIEQLCPGSPIAQTAATRTREIIAQRTKATEDAGAEEAEERPAPPKMAPHGDMARKVEKLVAMYHQACAEGRLAEARRLAAVALTLDPTCFSKKENEDWPDHHRQ